MGTKISKKKPPDLPASTSLWKSHILQNLIHFNPPENNITDIGIIIEIPNSIRVLPVSYSKGHSTQPSKSVSPISANGEKNLSKYNETLSLTYKGASPFYRWNSLLSSSPLTIQGRNVPALLRLVGRSNRSSYVPSQRFWSLRFR
jgi:hypothetical protein